MGTSDSNGAAKGGIRSGGTEQDDEHTCGGFVVISLIRMMQGDYN